MNILPKPTGPFNIGRTIRYLVDQTRNEKFSNELKPRELIIEIYYPSESHKEKIGYAYEIMDDWKKGLQNSGFKKEEIGELDGINSYALPNANFLKPKKAYPMIIFSHGYVALSQTYAS